MRPGLIATAVLLLAVALPAAAEPYLAVRQGLACTGCHVNPTGGGLRNAYGNVFSQQQLPMVPMAGEDVWTGTVLDRFGIGANGRVAGRYVDRDDTDDALDFQVDRVTAYGSATLNEHVVLYVDQQLAPGGSANREAWIRLGWRDFYVRAGRFFLPYGWRLEDNDAFIRRETGVNMNQGDDGVELGWNTGRFDAELAVTNGNGGGSEVDDGKLVSGRFAWIAGPFQLGVSGYHNDTDSIDRTMAGVFGGLRTGPVTWLAEYDRIEDEGDVLGTEKSGVALLEADWLIARGNNLKATVELQHLDGSLEDRFRYSLVYELFPWAFTQLRAGVRIRDSDDPDPRFNTDEGFVQLHAFF
ncbi:MAG: hypothetical protein PVH91_17085 [Pseudomonadales bacterium]|jgi:hypothetical protein